MDHFYDKIDGWSSETDQGRLLETILPLIKPRANKKFTIAEIGVYKGRCTAMWNVMLLNKGIDFEYHAIDHFEGSSEHEKGVDYYSITLENLKSIENEERLKVIRSDSLSQVKKYKNSYFDVVYIDASHEYEFVKADIEAWLPKVRKGGIICGDDYISPGWEGVVQAVDEVFSRENVNVVGVQQWWVQK